MLAQERRQLIVNELNRAGMLLTTDIAAQMGVSEVTIRADLDYLEGRGRLSRVRGGAVPTETSMAVDAFDLRMAIRSDAKRIIARAAAEYIQNDQTIIIDAGTTTHYLAQAMPEVSNLTVYTPGLPLAQNLVSVHGLTTHLMGGRVDPGWLQTVGTPGVQGLDGVTAHTAFIGCATVDEDLDVVDHSRDVAQVKQNVARHARRLVLLVDSSKLGKHGPTKVLPVDRVDTVITDEDISPEFRRRLLRCNIELVVAS